MIKKFDIGHLLDETRLRRIPIILHQRLAKRARLDGGLGQGTGLLPALRQCDDFALPKQSPLADFFCASCSEEFEFKSQKGKFGTRVVDGAFKTKCERLAASNNPNQSPGGWWQKSPVTRESPEETVKTIARGKPDDPVEPVVSNSCAFYFAHEAAGAVGARLSPCPL